MSRRIVLLTVSVFMLLFMVACGGGESEPEAAPTEAVVKEEPTEEVVVEEEPTEEVVVEEPTEEVVVEEAPTEEVVVEEPYPAPTAVVEVQTESYPQPASEEPYNPYPEPDEAEGNSEAAAGSRTFQVVTEESDASYSVEEEFFGGAVTRLGKELGFFGPVGVTQEVSGQLTLNLDGSPTLESGEITVDISQLTSDDNRRDGRIRDRHLESAKYPLATFVATGIEGAPESYADGQEATFMLLGDITIREITKPMTFDVTASLNGDTITGVATTELLMTDFGFDPPNVSDMFIVQNEVFVTVNLTARETP